jgi:fructose-1,6-bisphosphatase/inositol monophosphatase family enzyme
MNHSWTEQLIELHRVVRLAVITSSREDTGNINSKGDVVKVFDLVANDAALKYLQTSAVPLLVESEESEPQTIGTVTPAYRLILDPVDGSDNWSRRLPLSALSCAVLPVDAPLKPESVIASIVGPLGQEIPLVAQQASGAWQGEAQLQTSNVLSLCITGLDGAPLRAASGLTDGISLIAAANKPLCDKIVERLSNVES